MAPRARAPARIAGAYLAALACAVAAPGCRPPRSAPTYPGGSAPSADTLLAAARPPLQAVAVARARIRLGAHRGTLAYLAQLPGRVRGSVTIAGNELLSLSVHEAGYQLVNKLDGLPQGYYEGPAPGDCAVAALVGLALSPAMLARLLLGGAPLPDGARPVEQAWDPEIGAERLVVRATGLEQALWFRAGRDGWRLVRVTTWARGAGGRGARLWTARLSDWRDVGGRMLPGKLELARHDRRRAPAAHITLLDVDPAPPWAPPATAHGAAGGAGSGAHGGDGASERGTGLGGRGRGGGDGAGSGAHPGNGTGASDRGQGGADTATGADDPWGASDGWDEDGGWENEPAPQASPAPGEPEPGASAHRPPGKPQPSPAANTRPMPDAPEPTPTPSRPAARQPRPATAAGDDRSPLVLPAIWRLPVPAALPHRGDLCARH